MSSLFSVVVLGLKKQKIIHGIRRDKTIIGELQEQHLQ